MAGKSGAGKGTGPPRAPKAKPGDERLLQRMAALLSAHPELDIAEVMHSIGVEDAVGQRRLRGQFEARRHELIDAVEARREQRAQPKGVAALQASKEPRVSSPPVEEAEAAEVPQPVAVPLQPAAPAPARPETAPARPEVVAAVTRAAAVAEKAAAAPGVSDIGLPPCAMAVPQTVAPVQSALPWIAVGMQAFTAGLRVQSAMIEAWLRLPPVTMALTQQAAAYNAMLDVAAATMPKAR